MSKATISSIKKTEHEVTFLEDFKSSGGREPADFKAGEKIITHLPPGKHTIEIFNYGRIPLSVVKVESFHVEITRSVSFTRRQIAV
jgi:hypothetical protein